MDSGEAGLFHIWYYSLILGLCFRMANFERRQAIPKNADKFQTIVYFCALEQNR